MLIVQPPFRILNPTSIYCKALCCSEIKMTKNLVFVQSSNLRKRKGEEHHIYTLTEKEKNLGCMLGRALLYRLTMATALPEALVGVKYVWPLGPHVESPSGRTYAFLIVEPSLGRRLCLSLWCFYLIGVQWFYCSNLFYGLSSALDYVIFELFYHVHFPFLFFLKWRWSVYGGERCTEWKWKEMEFTVTI